jgi:glucose/arabinose dehydrogenase
MRPFCCAAAAISLAALAACTEFPIGDAPMAEIGGRRVRASDVVVPTGYTIEPIATGLTFPTGIATDDQGHIYVTEAGYSCGEVWGQARLIRIEDDGQFTIIASGGHPPWSGVDWRGGAFFIAEGGESGGGRILRIDGEGDQARSTVLVDNLPSVGDHHTNGPVAGPDGYIYFGQGTATNSGIVGMDNLQMGWLRQHPGFHDIPARDVTLAGVNAPSLNMLDPLTREPVTTGAFASFGSTSRPGQVIKGQLPCTGGIMRIPAAGGPLELVAWGLRNPFGLAFSGMQLFTTENSCDARGSRPVANAPDVLWCVQEGGWYGWPDYQAGEPIFDDAHRAPARSAPKKLLAADPAKPPRPAASFGVRAAPYGLAFAPNDRFGFVGEAFVAQFGDMTPAFGKVLAPSGFKVVRVNVRTGEVRDFAANVGGGADGQSGPASRLHNGGLERPIAVRFSHGGEALYILDFGVMNVSRDGAEPIPGTGVLWRVTRTGGAMARAR